MVSRYAPILLITFSREALEPGPDHLQSFPFQPVMTSPDDPRATPSGLTITKVCSSPTPCPSPFVGKGPRDSPGGSSEPEVFWHFERRSRRCCRLSARTSSGTWIDSPPQKLQFFCSTMFFTFLRASLPHVLSQGASERHLPNRTDGGTGDDPPLVGDHQG